MEYKNNNNDICRVKCLVNGEKTYGGYVWERYDISMIGTLRFESKKSWKNIVWREWYVWVDINTPINWNMFKVHKKPSEK